MQEQTNNDAPGADRPAARPDRETPPRTAGAARPKHQIEAGPRDPARR